MTAMHPKLSLDGILCSLIPLYNNGLRSILKRHSGQVTTILQSYAILNPTKGPFVNYVSMLLPIFDQVSTLSKHIY